MVRRRVRWLALVALCGTVFQATTGCEQIWAPLVASLASTIVTNFISSLLLST